MKSHKNDFDQSKEKTLQLIGERLNQNKVSDQAKYLSDQDFVNTNEEVGHKSAVETELKNKRKWYSPTNSILMNFVLWVCFVGLDIFLAFVIFIFLIP